MKRKIAAIMAADVAGFSKLVAEDEEETLRRLVAYRAVFDESVTRHGGRVFNTAGDAVMSEFASAVEAVRCALDLQESLRGRNRAYPPSRQMNFRIGITIGDVVERDGDLLGDGVNIAARLQALASAGGICVSHWVYEQVSNKLSVTFKDIGKQTVKNIPNPVHAFTIAGHMPANIEPVEVPDEPAADAGDPPAIVNRQLKPILLAGAVALSIGLVAFAWRHRPIEPKPVAPAPSQTTIVTPSAPPAAEAAKPSSPAIVAPADPAQEADRGTSKPSAATSPPPIFKPLRPLAPDASETEPSRPAASAGDKKRKGAQCAEIMVRAQLGELTAEDRNYLKTECR